MGLILDKPNKTHLYSVQSTACSPRAASHLLSLSAFFCFTHFFSSLFSLGVLEVFEGYMQSDTDEQ